MRELDRDEDENCKGKFIVVVMGEEVIFSCQMPKDRNRVGDLLHSNCLWQIFPDSVTEKWLEKNCQVKGGGLFSKRGDAIVLYDGSTKFGGFEKNLISIQELKDFFQVKAVVFL